MTLRRLILVCLLTTLACADNVHPRGRMDNARLRFERDKAGHVAFLGGSITEMNGYRPMVMAALQKRFPETKFTFTSAGISSTCSTTGAFRLKADVLDAGPVDLLFVEFAVNDDQDAGHPRIACIRGMEGIVRQLRRHNPRADVVFTHFINEGMMETLEQGKTPLTAEAHDEVAKHYAIPTIDLQREVTEQIVAGKLTWKEFGGVHPAPCGNAIAAGMIERLMDRMWKDPSPADARATDHPMPAPLDPQSYANGRFVDPNDARPGKGWTIAVPDWKTLKGSTRGQFNKIPLLCATDPGAELKLEFTGTAIGAFLAAGPDAGILEASVDGGPAVDVDLYHRFSAGLHYPRTVMFATDLRPGPHTLILRVKDETNSAGHAARIMKFVAN